VESAGTKDTKAHLQTHAETANISPLAGLDDPDGLRFES
jgi:hypothetical protein